MLKTKEDEKGCMKITKTRLTYTELKNILISMNYCYIQIYRIIERGYTVTKTSKQIL